MCMSNFVFACHQPNSFEKVFEAFLPNVAFLLSALLRRCLEKRIEHPIASDSVERLFTASLLWRTSRAGTGKK